MKNLSKTFLYAMMLVALVVSYITFLYLTDFNEVESICILTSVTLLEVFVMLFTLATFDYGNSEELEKEKDVI